MSNLGVIRSLFRSQISQSDSTNSDISDADANNYANQSARYAATIVKWPRDHAQWTVQTNYNTYDLPSDFMSVISVKFGDQAAGTMNPIKVYNERELDEQRPGWLNTNSASLGIPDVLLLLDRFHFLLNPTPDANSNGKLVIMTYSYYPATMVNDADEPDLPLIYHDFLPTYMAALAYGAQLKNPELATAKTNEFLSKIKSVELQATQEKEQINFFWSAGYGIDDNEFPTVKIV